MRREWCVMEMVLHVTMMIRIVEIDAEFEYTRAGVEIKEFSLV